MLEEVIQNQQKIFENKMDQMMKKQEELLHNQKSQFIYELNQMKQTSQELYMQLEHLKKEFNKLKEEIEEKDKKIDTLKNIIYDIDSHCIDQIDNLDIFNDLNGETQFFIISEKVRKIGNSYLQLLENLLSYISNEQQKPTPNINITNFITIESKDKKRRLSDINKNDIIKVKANVTEMLFLHRSVNTKKLFEMIQHFGNFFFEIQYPSTNYKNIIDFLLNEKKLNSLLNFNILVIINGIEETGKAFMNNLSISSIVIDKTVKKISSHSFEGCKSLTDVFISDSVINIDDCCFKDCVSLKKIVFPDSVREIGNDIIKGCRSLKKLVLPPFVEKIQENFFSQYGAEFKTLYAYDKNYSLVKMNDYNLQYVQNKISYFNVYIGTIEQNGKKVFIKKTKDPLPYILDYLKRIQISRLDIPGLLKIQGYSIVSSHLYVVKEFLGNGNVFDCNKEYLESEGAKHNKINPTVRCKIIFGVAAIMKHLHDHNVILGNLSNWNVLLNDDLEPVICSFSASQFKKEKEDLIYPLYQSWFISPEVLMCKVFGFPSDVYSYGMFLYTMFSTKEDPYDYKYRIADRIIKGARPTLSNDIPEIYQELICYCWDGNPDDRPTFKEITSYLKSDSFALNEFGMETDMEQLREYQDRIECSISSL